MNEPWKDRVIVEKKELDEKISGLTAYLDETAAAGEYTRMNSNQLGLLQRQLGVMQEYSRILGERLT